MDRAVRYRKYNIFTGWERERKKEKERRMEGKQGGAEARRGAARRCVPSYISRSRVTWCPTTWWCFRARPRSESLERSITRASSLARVATAQRTTLLSLFSSLRSAPYTGHRHKRPPLIRRALRRLRHGTRRLETAVSLEIQIESLLGTEKVFTGKSDISSIW